MKCCFSWILTDILILSAKTSFPYQMVSVFYLYVCISWCFLLTSPLWHTIPRNVCMELIWNSSIEHFYNSHFNIQYSSLGVLFSTDTWLFVSNLLIECTVYFVVIGAKKKLSQMEVGNICNSTVTEVNTNGALCMLDNELKGLVTKLHMEGIYVHKYTVVRKKYYIVNIFNHKIIPTQPFS